MKLFALILSLFTTIASAGEVAQFVKAAHPEVSVWTKNDTPLEVNVAKTVIAAFATDDWVNIHGAWENVSDAAKAVAEKSDPGIGCYVSVRQVDTSKTPIAYIDMECGPLNTYGNGIWLRASYNNMVVPKPESMGASVPGQVADMYRKYAEIQRRGVTGFTLRDSYMPSLQPLGKLPAKK